MGISNFKRFLPTGLKTRKATVAMGAATAALGLASAAKGFDNRSKYEVVYLGSNGPAYKVVKAKSALMAIDQVKNSVSGSGFKAFELPHREDDANEYYESLSNKSHSDTKSNKKDKLKKAALIGLGVGTGVGAAVGGYYLYKNKRLHKPATDVKMISGPVHIPTSIHDKYGNRVASDTKAFAFPVLALKGLAYARKGLKAIKASKAVTKGASLLNKAKPIAKKVGSGVGTAMNVAQTASMVGSMIPPKEQPQPSQDQDQNKE